MTEKSTLEIINEITELNELKDFLNDEQLDTALELVIKLMMKPDVPSSRAPALIVQLQALSAKFAILASVYATILRDKAGTENNYKKNIYFSLKEALDKLADALKYTARFGMNNNA